MTLLSAACLSAAPPKPEYAIAIHGGAGLEPAKLSPEGRRAHEAALTKAIEVGRAILAKGGTALDAVEQTIRALEDDPLYNAGKGAVFNSEGQHELDAAIMDGESGKAGAVAGVMTVQNPISLARLVMTETRHVLLQGAGADQFAAEQAALGKKAIVIVDNAWFSTDARRKEWEEARRLEAEREKPARKHGMGTVGCVALDKHGNLAAGTSTGGLTNKKWGRVGAAPLIGAGTYANNQSCAVSCTGTGEYFMLHSIAFQLHALLVYKQLPLEDAVKHLIDEVLVAEPEIGGLIAIDKQGRISMRTNTPGMARAMADSTGLLKVLLER
jgi:beta-aspartyl-peptidase (threonine type)